MLFSQERGGILPIMESSSLKRNGKQNVKKWRMLAPKIERTRRLDLRCMEVMGIQNEVLGMMENVGLDWFATRFLEIYRGLTLEFLVTLEVKNYTRLSFPRIMKFKLRNTEYTYASKDMNQLFHSLRKETLKDWEPRSGFVELNF